MRKIVRSNDKKPNWAQDVAEEDIHGKIIAERGK